jgi:hypothetical protein
MLYALDVERRIERGIWPEWSSGRVRLIRPKSASPANDNRRSVLALIGDGVSFAAGRGVGRAAALLALACVAWWGATLQRDQQSAFDRIAATLTGKRVIDAGPIAIADCGPKGCGDPSDTVYRFAIGSASCFSAADTRLVGQRDEAGFGTGMLVADERGRQSLLLLDDDLRSVVAVATEGVHARPCPRRHAPEQKTASGV